MKYYYDFDDYDFGDLVIFNDRAFVSESHLHNKVVNTVGMINQRRVRTSQLYKVYSFSLNRILNTYASEMDMLIKYEPMEKERNK